MEHDLKEIIQSGNRRFKAEEDFKMLNGYNDLEEVVVEYFLLSPEMEEAHKRFGDPDVIISGDIILEKEEKWSYGLYSIFLFNFADQVRIEQFPRMVILAFKKKPIMLSRKPHTQQMIFCL